MPKPILITLILFVQLCLFAQTEPGTEKVSDPRKIISIEVKEDGNVYWTSIGESSKLPYVIELFRWNKWIKVGEVDAAGIAAKSPYSFRVAPSSGENIARVKAYASSNEIKEVKWTSKAPKVDYKIDKGKKEINFFDKDRPTETLYEIIDSEGKYVKKGWNSFVSYDNLPKGTYTLNYDNSSAEFKK